MEKLSHKGLLAMADIKLNCNIYTGENVIYYLQRKDFDSIKKELNAEANETALKQLESITNAPQYLYITCEKIGYAAGTYGNLGQLFKIRVDLGNDDIVTIATIGF